LYILVIVNQVSNKQLRSRWAASDVTTQR